jgi:hypothetical protein
MKLMISSLERSAKFEKEIEIRYGNKDPTTARPRDRETD